jgi:hypothetical protein
MEDNSNLWLLSGGRKMSKFQARHYEAIAEALGYADANKRTIDQVSRMFNHDNRNFKEYLFRERIEQYRRGVCQR